MYIQNVRMVKSMRVHGPRVLGEDVTLGGGRRGLRQSDKRKLSQFSSNSEGLKVTTVLLWLPPARLQLKAPAPPTWLRTLKELTSSLATARAAPGAATELTRTRRTKS